MSNDITVTRNHTNDTFTYQHRTDKEPTIVTMKDIFRTGHQLLDLHDRTEAALYFLMNVLETHADAGKSLDEYGVRGLSALCSCICDVMTTGMDDHRAVARVIEGVVAQR